MSQLAGAAGDFFRVPRAPCGTLSIREQIGMCKELEKEVPSVNKEQDDRDAVGKRKDVGFLFVARDRGTFPVLSPRDTEVECRRDEDGDDREQKQRGIQLGRSRCELLFGVSCSAPEPSDASQTRGEEERKGEAYRRKHIPHTSKRLLRIEPIKELCTTCSSHFIRAMGQRSVLFLGREGKTYR